MHWNRDGMYLHKWIDVQDPKAEKWYEAQVVGIDERSQTILAHFRGYSSKSDETIGKSSSRIAIFHSHTPIGPTHDIPELSIGCVLDVEDCIRNWHEGIIIQIDHIHGMLLVHFRGYPSSMDEWINIDSGRFAILHTFTNRPEKPITLKRGIDTLTTFSASSENEIRFKSMLRSHRNWEIIEMQADGNCLFRSVSHQLYGTPEHHLIVRLKCAEYMQSQSVFFSQFIEGGLTQFASYLTALRRDGEWGDHIELQAISEVYQRPIEVYAFQSVPIHVYTQKGTGQPIRLSYHFRSHYNSIVEENQIFSLSDSVPGAFESKTIAEAKQYGVPQDEQKDEADPISNALLISRSEFEQRDADLYERAVQTSLDEFQHAMESIVEESINDEVKRVMHLTQNEISSIESMQLGSAVDESLAEVHPAIQMMTSMGYPLEMVQEAFGVVRSMVGQVPEELMVQYLMNFMLEGDILGL